jgi:hypothetical protein
MHRITAKFVPPTLDKWSQAAMCKRVSWAYGRRLTSLLWFRFVSHIENESKGVKFWNIVWYPKAIVSGTRQHYKMTMAFLKRRKSNGIAVYVPKEHFWRRWQSKLSWRSISHFSFVLVREVSDVKYVIIGKVFILRCWLRSPSRLRRVISFTRQTMKLRVRIVNGTW